MVSLKKTTTFSKALISKTNQNKSNEKSNSNSINFNLEINPARMDTNNKMRTLEDH